MVLYIKLIPSDTYKIYNLKQNHQRWHPWPNLGTKMFSDCRLWFLKTLLGLQLQDNSRSARKKRSQKLFQSVNPTWFKFLEHNLVGFCFSRPFWSDFSVPLVVKNDEKPATFRSWSGGETVKPASMIPLFLDPTNQVRHFSGAFWFFFTFLGISCFKPHQDTRNCREISPNWIPSKYPYNLVNGITPFNLTGVYFASPLSGICALYMYVYKYIYIYIIYIYTYMRVHIATNTKLCAFSVEYWNLTENLTTLLPFLPWSLDRSRLDWRLLGCVGLFLWPIPGNLLKMHASSERASIGWTKPFDTRKDRIFTTRWTSRGRFRDLGV